MNRPVRFTVIPPETEDKAPAGSRCPGCGADFLEPVEGLPKSWYWLDGTSERLCTPCVREKVALIDHREDLRLARRLAELGR